MCGIIGVAGALEKKDEDLIRRLLIFDYFRGPDSTGFAALNKKGELRVAKVPSHPLDLFDMIKFRQALIGIGSSVFLGHNRLATKGRLNTANTHPFCVDHIVGVHNGTLDLSSHRALEKELNEEFEVDSQAIIAAIAALGPKKTIALLSGSWSIVYLNLKRNTLNFIRNDERPMWLAHTEDFKRLIWASEWNIIDQAVSFGSYNEKLYQDKDGNTYFPTTPDTHYSFNIDALTEAKNKPRPSCMEMKGREKLPLSYGSSGSSGRTYSPWHDDSWWDDKNDNVIQLPPKPKDRVVVHLEASIDEPFAGRLSREQFKKLLDGNGGGCTWCGDPILWGTEGLTIYDHDEMILCPNCGTAGVTGNTRIYTRSSLGL